jgi:hypothetical protein
MASMMSLRDRSRPAVLKHVVLHAKLQSRYSDTSKGAQLRKDVRESGFSTELIKANVRSLDKLVRGLRWERKRSQWSGYRDDNSYSPEDDSAKASYVEKIASAKRRSLVCDLGANDGRYSRIAAPFADTVIAADIDHLVVERLYRTLKAEGNRTILPLVFDVADPSPALGWTNQERPAFFRRGKPDLLLCLAVVHHLALSRNVPLERFAAWVAAYAEEAILEFPTRDDPQVARLIAGKQAGVHDDYGVATFERALDEHFVVADSYQLPSGRRILYHAHRRNLAETRG